jgi:hypothetical protein
MHCTAPLMDLSHPYRINLARRFLLYSQEDNNEILK